MDAVQHEAIHVSHGHIGWLAGETGIAVVLGGAAAADGLGALFVGIGEGEAEGDVLKAEVLNVALGHALDEDAAAPGDEDIAHADVADMAEAGIRVAALDVDEDRLDAAVREGGNIEGDIGKRDALDGAAIIHVEADAGGGLDGDVGEMDVAEVAAGAGTDFQAGGGGFERAIGQSAGRQLERFRAAIASRTRSDTPNNVRSEAPVGASLPCVSFLACHGNGSVPTTLPPVRTRVLPRPAGRSSLRSALGCAERQLCSAPLRGT